MVNSKEAVMGYKVQKDDVIHVDGEKINIGEFQIHFKSRNVIKFRFYKSLFV